MNIALIHNIVHSSLYQCSRKICFYLKTFFEESVHGHKDKTVPRTLGTVLLLLHVTSKKPEAQKGEVLLKAPANELCN